MTRTLYLLGDSTLPHENNSRSLPSLSLSLRCTELTVFQVIRPFILRHEKKIDETIDRATHLAGDIIGEGTYELRSVPIDEYEHPLSRFVFANTDCFAYVATSIFEAESLTVHDRNHSSKHALQISSGKNLIFPWTRS